jgi:predicted Zn-ribbon and HTH transcriptional regulator
VALSGRIRMGKTLVLQATACALCALGVMTWARTWMPSRSDRVGVVWVAPPGSGGSGGRWAYAKSRPGAVELALCCIESRNPLLFQRWPWKMGGSKVRWNLESERSGGLREYWSDWCKRRWRCGWANLRIESKTIASPSLPEDTTVVERSVAFPHWLLIVASGSVPLWRLARVGMGSLRRRRPGHDQLCRSCGYDCRATPGRCPECGTPAFPPEPSPSSPA